MVYSPLTIAWGVVERDVNRFVCLARIHTYLSEFLIIFEATLSSLILCVTKFVPLSVILVVYEETFPISK